MKSFKSKIIKEGIIRNWFQSLFTRNIYKCPPFSLSSSLTLFKFIFSSLFFFILFLFLLSPIFLPRLWVQVFVRTSLESGIFWIWNFFLSFLSLSLILWFHSFLTFFSFNSDSVLLIDCFSLYLSPHINVTYFFSLTFFQSVFVYIFLAWHVKCAICTWLSYFWHLKRYWNF